MKKKSADCCFGKESSIWRCGKQVQREKSREKDLLIEFRIFLVGVKNGSGSESEEEPRSFESGERESEIRNDEQQC